MRQAKSKQSQSKRPYFKQNRPKNPSETIKLDPKAILKAITKSVILTFWVCLVVFLAELLVGIAMTLMFGKETLSMPVPTAVYSAVAYVLGFVAVWQLTPRLINVGRKFLAQIRSNANSYNQPTNHRKLSTQQKSIVSKPSTRDHLGLKGLPTWTDIGLAAVGYIVAMLVAARVLALIGAFGLIDMEEAQELSFETYIVGFDRIVAFITLVIVAPIFEELIFRGWLYDKLRNIFAQKVNYYWGVGIAIFLVSLAFGILHGQWNVGITVFIMSVIMCIMREITGTIYGGILVHIIKNCIAFYLLYVAHFGM